MTRVVISQPMYFPWPGFLAQMALADVYVWLDDAMFSKGSFTNRIQVKLGAERKWMSVPLDGKGTGQRIMELSAAKPGWQAAHRALLAQSLAGKPERAMALEMFDGVAATAPLCDLLIASTEIMARALGILPARVLRASALDVAGSGWPRVRDMVAALGGTRYLTGHGAAAYLDHEAFEAAGIEVAYMDYRVGAWPQDGAFTPYVSALDLIASCGADGARERLNPATVPWRDFLEERSMR